MIIPIIAFMAAAIAGSGDAAGGAQTAASTDAPPASSAPADPATPIKVKKVKDPGDKIVCITDAVTGSHLGGEPICKKQKEWDAITNASRQMLNDTNRMQNGYKPPNG